MTADDIVPDQDSQHPVGTLYRNIAKCFLGALIAEGNLPRPAVHKIRFRLFIAIAIIDICIPQGIQQVLPGLEIAKLLIGQTLSIVVVQAAVGLIIIGLQGK